MTGSAEGARFFSLASRHRTALGSRSTTEPATVNENDNDNATVNDTNTDTHWGHGT